MCTHAAVATTACSSQQGPAAFCVPRRAWGSARRSMRRCGSGRLGWLPCACGAACAALAWGARDGCPMHAVKHALRRLGAPEMAALPGGAQEPASTIPGFRALDAEGVRGYLASEPGLAPRVGPPGSEASWRVCDPPLPRVPRCLGLACLSGLREVAAACGAPAAPPESAWRGILAAMLSCRSACCW